MRKITKHEIDEKLKQVKVVLSDGSVGTAYFVNGDCDTATVQAVENAYAKCPFQKGDIVVCTNTERVPFFDQSVRIGDAFFVIEVDKQFLTLRRICDNAFFKLRGNVIGFKKVGKMEE